jgi:HEPN domain-containing protein
MSIFIARASFHDKKTTSTILTLTLLSNSRKIVKEVERESARRSRLSFEEAERLRKRAEGFLRNAMRLIDEGEADLAIFNLEQYCQLMLKYRLLITKGTYLRTHSLRRLIKELGEVDSRVLTLISDLRNLHYVARLEESYIASRYLPIEYTIEEVKDVAKFVLEVFKPLVESAQA